MDLKSNSCVKIIIPNGWIKVPINELMEIGDFYLDVIEEKPFVWNLTWKEVKIKIDENWEVEKGMYIIRKKEGNKRNYY